MGLRKERRGETCGQPGVCGPTTLLSASGSQGATRKYKVWMRHRYHSCCNRLRELLAHPSFEVKVSQVVGLASTLRVPCTPSRQAAHTQAGVRPQASACPRLPEDVWFSVCWVS